jgi:hypothetical protein
MIFWYFAGGMAALWGLLGSYVMVIRWVWKPIKLKGTTYSLVRPQWSRATDADLTPEERDELGRLSADFARAGFGPPVMHLLTGSISGADGLGSSWWPAPSWPARSRSSSVPNLATGPGW